MAPAKTNYKSYDAQARLLRAIVAAHPEVKWNYKEITECYGSDMTPDALNHRFRHLRAEAVLVHEARKQGGFDMKDLRSDRLPKTQGAVDKDNIATYFGSSTADGVQFQFRAIKKEAAALKEAAENGDDPQQVLIDGGKPAGNSTPRKTLAKKAISATPASRKRKSPVKAEVISDDDDDTLGSGTQDYSEMDVDTPSKKAKTGEVQKTPSRGSKTKAAAQKNPDLTTSASNSDGGDVCVTPASIFGNPQANASQAFNRGAVDSFIGNSANTYSSGGNFSFEGDGEI